MSEYASIAQTEEARKKATIDELPSGNDAFSIADAVYSGYLIADAPRDTAQIGLPYVTKTGILPGTYDIDYHGGWPNGDELRVSYTAWTDPETGQMHRVFGTSTLERTMADSGVKVVQERPLSEREPPNPIEAAEASRAWYWAKVMAEKGAELDFYSEAVASAEMPEDIAELDTILADFLNEFKATTLASYLLPLTMRVEELREELRDKTAKTIIDRVASEFAELQPLTEVRGMPPSDYRAISQLLYDLARGLANEVRYSRVEWESLHSKIIASAKAAQELAR